MYSEHSHSVNAISVSCLLVVSLFLFRPVFGCFLSIFLCLLIGFVERMTIQHFVMSRDYRFASCIGNEFVTACRCDGFRGPFNNHGFLFEGSFLWSKDQQTPRARVAKLFTNCFA